ncbi:hypothetical protein DWQ65_08190 [Treponema phagedenis]|uniref:Leucine Rich Repeat protein n=2 Tax=Treponema phagedenis TaxID=162 RepID=A0AAE6IX70_TREPH|nr:hypothetical protein FUT79_13265 [Treponema phagedenis]QEJ99027.1 hypothetical protein FUT82_14195 [Treponema phagedenis]QEK01837.1 hypothetical protein FUT84_12180 [Treponema phagedenis]QEK04537.1 hypothetical protein FUT83_12505 [Treponema phagedenis]QEK06951.1 hypothetical protein FUT80_09670 [Treponema phagedenis]
MSLQTTVAIPEKNFRRFTMKSCFWKRATMLTVLMVPIFFAGCPIIPVCNENTCLEKSEIIVTEISVFEIKLSIKTSDGSSRKVFINGIEKEEIPGNDQNPVVYGAPFCAELIIKDPDNKIQALTCSYTNLIRLDASVMVKLQKLDCSGRQLTTLKLNGCTALKELTCSGNPALESSLPQILAAVPNLQTLHCYRNKLTSLDISMLPALQKLDCSGNQLTLAAFKQLFNNLPDRTGKPSGIAVLYDDYYDNNDKTCTSLPEFTATKNKNWIFYKNYSLNDENKL